MKWCNYYNMWCNDVDFLLDGCQECDMDCENCEEMEVIK